MNIPFSITQTLPDDTKLDSSQSLFIDQYPQEKITWFPILLPTQLVSCPRNTVVGPSNWTIVETVWATVINGYFINSIRGAWPTWAWQDHITLWSETRFQVIDTSSAAGTFTLAGKVRFASIFSLASWLIIGSKIKFAPCILGWTNLGGSNAYSINNVVVSVYIYLMNTAWTLTLCSTLTSTASWVISVPVNGENQLFMKPFSQTNTGVASWVGDRLVVELEVSGSATIWLAAFAQLWVSLWVISSINSFMSSRNSYRPIDLYI